MAKRTKINILLLLQMLNKDRDLDRFRSRFLDRSHAHYQDQSLHLIRVPNQLQSLNQLLSLPYLNHFLSLPDLNQFQYLQGLSLLLSLQDQNPLDLNPSHIAEEHGQRGHSTTKSAAGKWLPFASTVVMMESARMNGRTIMREMELPTTPIGHLFKLMAAIRALKASSLNKSSLKILHWLHRRLLFLKKKFQLSQLSRQIPNKMIQWLAFLASMMLMLKCKCASMALLVFPKVSATYSKSHWIDHQFLLKTLYYQNNHNFELKFNFYIIISAFILLLLNYIIYTYRSI